MMDINWDWVKDQLEKARVPQEHATSVTRLLETLETMRLSDDPLRSVLDTFQRLSLGYTIVPDSANERWVEVLPGNYAIGNTVRVKSDAYDGKKSTLHNGRRGRVVAVRSGKTVVLYDDTENNEEQYYHDPSVLERLV